MNEYSTTRGKRILVTGAGGSAGVNFVRSLRLFPESFSIIGTDTSKFHIKLSKTGLDYLVPPCYDRNYISELNRIIDKEKIGFLHAQPDPEVLAISENRNHLNAKTFLPSHEAIVLSQNKYLFNQHMKSRGVPVPYTRLVVNEEVLKLSFYSTKDKLWLRSASGAGSLAALPVTNAEHAAMWIDYWTPRGITWGQFIISEYLPGKEYAFQSLWHNGEIYTSAARERLEYLFQNRMPSGQSSTPTIAKSVHNEQVNQIATQAILALDEKPHGVYCVDLKENYEGVPCVMEINAGRFFTTSLFFATAGLNMPAYYVKLGYGDIFNKIYPGHRKGQIPEYNAVPPDLYWIRQIDCGEIMVRGDNLESTSYLYNTYKKR